MKTLFRTLLVLAASVPHLCSAQEVPTLSGVITRFASPADFDVNGTHVLVASSTHFQTSEIERGVVVHQVYASPDPLQLHLGSAVEIEGRPGSPFAATTVATRPSPPHAVTGTALIEAVSPVASGASSGTLVRADGYTITLTPGTSIKYTKPLGAPGDLRPNVWISYSGKLQPDGTVLAKSIKLDPNQVSKASLAQKDYWEYDPSIVPTDTHQSGGSKAFRGIDPAQFPLCHDAAAQSRVESIGRRLIPAWQTALPATDPTRINFRFYVVQADDSRSVYPLPSGIMLVPCKLVDRLQNDSQLAAVLADKMAGLLEQQPQPLPLTDAQLGAEAAMTGAEFIPVAGALVSAVSLTSGLHERSRIHRDLEQRERVELSLLQQAGFDATQAPVAHWMLTSKEPKDLAKIHPPPHALDLYALIGQEWTQLTPPKPAPDAPQ